MSILPPSNNDQSPLPNENLYRRKHRSSGVVILKRLPAASDILSNNSTSPSGVSHPGLRSKRCARPRCCQRPVVRAASRRPLTTLREIIQTT